MRGSKYAEFVILPLCIPCEMLWQSLLLLVFVRLSTNMISCDVFACCRQKINYYGLIFPRMSNFSYVTIVISSTFVRVFIREISL